MTSFGDFVLWTVAVIGVPGALASAAVLIGEACRAAWRRRRMSALCRARAANRRG